ncbi:DKNYY domain-containing protein [Candidatus Merdisoma sp. JLR.KK011]|mgnify:FL=1|uniref:DKNYY domain-containing protein n=1 Tax=Candidatus Merdisoma sp. JLR.KK011 TaxID=3114299 RepID=UPI002FF3E665
MGYARILKDNNGKPSGYRECDGEVAFMPEQQSYENIFRRVKIDLATMEVLSHDFIKDKERVYRRGILLRDITPEGFHVFNPAYIGNHQIIYTPYGDAKIAHPETFEILDDGIGMYGPEGYGRDAEFVYFFTYSTETRHAVRLKTCKNPAAFTILTDGYTKDDERVYFCQVTVKRAIPQSFAVLSDGYARDDKHIFWRDQLLKAKVQNFVILGDGYANDGRQVFHNGVPLDADSKAFALLGYSYASDGIRIFGEGKQLDTTPQSFMLLSDGYARDDKHIFWGNRLVDADFDSFRVMEDGDAEDNYRYFFHGTMIKKKVQR